MLYLHEHSDAVRYKVFAVILGDKLWRTCFMPETFISIY